MKARLVVTALALCALSSVAFAQTPPPGGGLRAADTNGDGNISRAEYTAAQAARFERQDANHDGSLSQDERQPPGGGGGGGGGGGSPPPGYVNPDANGDGVVTRAEFDATGATRFDRMDANHNGVIEASELPQGPPGGAR